MSGAETHFQEKNSDKKLETFLFTSESVGEGHPGNFHTYLYSKNSFFG